MLDPVETPSFAQHIVTQVTWSANRSEAPVRLGLGLTMGYGFGFPLLGTCLGLGGVELGRDTGGGLGIL